MWRMFRCLWAGLVAGMFSAGVSAANQIVPGVEYELGSYRGDAYHVLRVDLGLVSLLPYSSSPFLTVEHMVPNVQRRLAPDEEVVAAVNSGYFYNRDSYSRLISRWGVEPAIRAASFDGRSPEHDKVAVRMRARSELHLVGSQAWIVPAETGVDRDLSARGIYVMGGGGRLLPPPPASLRMTDPDRAPDPNIYGDSSRTVAAFNSASRNELFLVTVDKQPGGGVNIAHLADLLQDLRFGGRRLYLDEAMTFDSGGSTQMWLKGSGLVSRNEAGGVARRVATALMVVAQKKAPTPPPPGPRSCNPDRIPTSSACRDWYLFGQCRRLTSRTEPFEIALLQEQADRYSQARAFLAGLNGSPDLTSVCGP